SAGIGKSFLLEYLIEKLKLKYNNKGVMVTATMGLAVLLIGRIMIHKFSQIGVINRTKEEIILKIKNSHFLLKHIINTKVLIIDEISMLSCDAFDLINEVLQEIHGNIKPFGGVQLIITGDKRKSYKLYAFLKGLNKLRLGIINEDFMQYINSLQRELICDKIINFFVKENNMLKCINCEAIFYRRDIGDLRRYFKNSHTRSRILEFKSEDWSVALSSVSQDNEDLPSHEQIMKYLERKNLADEILCLKVGAKVISIYNNQKNEKIVNGTFGKVVGFRSKINDQIYGRERMKISNFLKEQNLDPVIKFENLNEKITVKRKTFFINNDDKKRITLCKQFPIILASAITIYKSQGLTLSNLVI
ncbi:27639_t:CDS:2, partial [Gigaspora margarita]